MKAEEVGKFNVRVEMSKHWLDSSALQGGGCRGEEEGLRKEGQMIQNITEKGAC